MSTQIFPSIQAYKKDQVDDSLRYLQSMSEEQQSLTVVVDSSKVYLDVEAIGGGDMHYNIEGVDLCLNCTTGSGVNGRARVELIQGTSTTVVRSICYVAYSEQNGCLELFSSIAFPSGGFAPVAVVGIRDHASVTANDPMIMQRTTEAVSHNNKGAISWMREKLRYLGAQWAGGVDQELGITTNAGSEDNIDMEFTSGVVFQLHRQNFPPMSISGDGIFVANASGLGALTNFQKLTDLNEIHEDSKGTALTDVDSLVLTIGGVMNYNGYCKLMVKLGEKNAVDADTVSEAKYGRLQNIRGEFKTVGFHICLLALKYNTADSGTWTNLLTASTLAWRSETKDVGSPNYPADYPRNSDVTTVLTKSGAVSVRVHFDAFFTEANYDFVYLYDGSDVLKYTYHGNLNEFTSGPITGATVKVRFVSDNNVQETGFHINALEYSEVIAGGAQVIDVR